MKRGEREDTPPQMEVHETGSEEVIVESTPQRVAAEHDQGRSLEKAFICSNLLGHNSPIFHEFSTWRRIPVTDKSGQMMSRSIAGWERGGLSQDGSRAEC